MRIDVATKNCQPGGTGTGFLIASNLVATVWHVVDGADYVRVTDPVLSLASFGRVVGLNREHDMALVRLTTQIPGHIFTLDTATPDLGTEMATIGFPRGRSIQITTGTITGAHSRQAVGGVGILSDVLLTDAVLNPGNSGGPWFTRDGRVIAVADDVPSAPTSGETPTQGNNGGVSSATASRDLARWVDTPESVPVGRCAITDPVDAARNTLVEYFFTIDSSDYASAYAQLDPAGHPNAGVTNFVANVETSFDAAPPPNSAKGLYDETGHGRSGSSGVYIDAEFVSHQDSDKGPRPGETCTLWDLRYSFVAVSGLWLIVGTTPTQGTQRSHAC